MGLNKEGSHSTSSPRPRLFVKHCFHTASLTLLTLLLPLSFLLLARLPYPSPSPSIPPPSAALLRSLVSFLSLSSLLYSLSGQLLRPRLAIAWPFLCTFELCVSLGIELIIAEAVKRTPAARTSRALWAGRAVFFLGLYETMLHWSRMFVRPVVDDAVFGADADERRVFDRAAIGAAFGALWLWVLRDDVEPLVLAAGKEGLVAAVSGRDGFVLWFVGYTTAVIGVLRVLQVAFFAGKLLFSFLCCCGVEGDDDASLSSFPEGAEV